MNTSRLEDDRNNILVGVSCFNSGEKIREIISKLWTLPYNVIMIDDVSSDNTPEIIRSEIDKEPNKTKFTFLQHTENRGIGYVIREMIEYAQSNRYGVLVVLTGSGKDDPLQVPTLAKPIIEGDADFVQGSRFLMGGSYRNLPFFRKLLIQTYTLIMYLFTGFRTTDATNGFRAFRLGIFEDPIFNLNQDWLDRYQCETYLQYKIMTGGYRIKEVAVSKDYLIGVKKYSYIRPFVDWVQIMSPLFLLKFKIRS